MPPSERIAARHDVALAQQRLRSRFKTQGNGSLDEHFFEGSPQNNSTIDRHATGAFPPYMDYLTDHFVDDPLLRHHVASRRPAHPEEGEDLAKYTRATGGVLTEHDLYPPDYQGLLEVLGPANFAPYPDRVDVGRGCQVFGKFQILDVRISLVMNGGLGYVSESIRLRFEGNDCVASHEYLGLEQLVQI